MGPVLDAAREDRRTWWLASLAALPLAYFLRPWDKSTVERAREAAAERAPSGDWRQRLPSSMPGAPTRPALDTVVEAVLDAVEPPPLWTAAIPVAAAGLAAAWFATRGRKPLPRQRSTKRLGQIMTRNVQVIRPEASLFEAASMMKQLNVGVLPVCDGRRLQGMLTDRDVVVRAVADSRDPQLAAVRDAMTAEVVYAYDDDSVEHGAELMRKHQIRRLPIVDRQKDLVGIVSLGDLAVDTGDDRLSGATLERVSEPARPRR
jgi:CBS domain-containing protein